MSDAAGGSSGQGNGGGAVIDEKLLRDCIYIEGNVRPGLGDDAAHGKSSNSPSYAIGRGKGGASRGPAGALLGVTAQQTGPVRVVELHEVTSLMLSYKKIGSINNLVGVDRLVKLHLDNNSIEKIENLGHLKHLKWLDLSFNRITAISGLEGLTELEDLSLHANKISVVEGLDANTKLTCLSLGRNCIDGLDDVAKYLHRFKDLRMLTLAGNKIEQQAHYRQRLLGYVRRLRFLDSRAVFEAEVAKAKDDLKEHLLPVDEADRKEEEAANAARVASEEAADYEEANCPDERRIHSDIMSLEPDGRNVGALLDVDTVRERVKDVLDPHQERFTAKAKDLADRMKEIRKLKRSDIDDYNRTLSRAKAAADLAGMEAIRNFEKKLNKVIPLGIRARPDEKYDERDVEQLRRALQELRSTLLEMEADQQDAYEALNKAFEDAMEKHKAEAVETLSSNFEELRGLEKSMFQDLSRKFDAWHDEKQRQQQDMAEGYGAAPQEGHTRDKDKQAMALMDNREEFTKVLLEWHELHTKKLDEREELHKRREEEGFKALQEKNKQAEHERNRWRVCEVAEYVKRRSEQLDRWESWGENM
uniref:Dynein regulatory complex subunit 3 n=1 Tax=Neobodo designis TaxID=312471 RepID=A0A7S1QTM1_NEODS|mmetsp:Transcript_5207/g.16519  ORF Transcript_5207/g.16519 Transcript_5207/m.16519 type:complete len:589 (+) Transcript_5207:45-1811(+)|eukprot:CAMPEP_0174850966 /NCGR_PEP_ID=MMETSP1114-20130205/21234_1 /TAXON_ID=312471 /ORGANISM="Neobodo designis, Strain CCAP 1951/1" /LENGTH=588 /DNA_ID=CAMNT_0016085463 /DNA_START=40 /DNA_END=1806 /DNA_ORIENTATION=-